MITAIDFGCCEIRTAYRDAGQPDALTLIRERSEYVTLPDQETYRSTLSRGRIPHAESESGLIVFGNAAQSIRWLSRQPCAPLFTDGLVPTDDAPARQILNILTQAMLPRAGGAPADLSCRSDIIGPVPLVAPEIRNGCSESMASDSRIDEPAICCYTSPCGTGDSRSAEFLSRLIRMQGYSPVYCPTSTAAILATGGETGFTGITICVGTERTNISVSRLGIPLAEKSIDIGSHWIDTEIARQLNVRTWDDTGACYLELDTVREWKHDPRLHLRNSTGDREQRLAALYGIMLDRVARTVGSLLQSPNVAAELNETRLCVVCCGGAAQVGGFAGAITERFVERGIAGRILSIRVAEDPVHTVVRGLLIQAELSRLSPGQRAA